jgi:hypothetical protein
MIWPSVPGLAPELVPVIADLAGALAEAEDVAAEFATERRAEAHRLSKGTGSRGLKKPSEQGSVYTSRK